jgi:SAM-dependent methyltransferase
MRDMTAPGGFDNDADGYHNGRPGYPPEIYRILTRRCGLRPGAAVLEVGAGTGQATRVLLDHGAHVTAVELGANLANRLRREVSSDDIEIIEGDIDAVALPESAFDLVACATAFHWLNSATAIATLARALKPGAWLAVWWNIFGDPVDQAPWRHDLNQLFLAHLPEGHRDPYELPAAMHQAERVAELEAEGLFGPTTVDVIRWQHRMTSTQVRALFGTFPNISGLPPARRDGFLDRIAALVDHHGGTVNDNFVTALYTAPRRQTIPNH